MLLIDDLLIILGLIVFEVVNSIDNAIVNAHVLQTMSALWRKRFLLVGIFTSVFLVRFLLPLFIVWVSVPNVSISDLFSAFVGGNDIAAKAIAAQTPVILTFGGVFLVFLYLHWLLAEKKDPLFIERYVKPNHGVWFFAIAGLLLVLVMYLARANPLMMLAAAIGSAVFFILYGLKQTAESTEENLQSAQGSNMSDLSKFIYLEVLDASFSFDGVIGAFAFTINLLLILIGIGIGAIVVRQLTVKGIDQVAKYRYLKNGAMTSIGFLGLFMLIEAFGFELPSYVPIVVTLLLVGMAFWISRKDLRKRTKATQTKPLVAS